MNQLVTVPFSSSFGGMKRSRRLSTLVDLDVTSGFRWLTPERCTLELHSPSELLPDVFRDMLSFSSSPGPTNGCCSTSSSPMFPKPNRKRAPPLNLSSYVYNGQYSTSSVALENNDDWCFGDLPPQADDVYPTLVAPLPRRFLVCSAKFSIKSNKSFLSDHVYDRHTSASSSPMLSMTG